VIKKKLTIVLFVSTLIVLSAGYETARCMTKGTCYTAEGVSKDTKNLLQGILKADQWFRKNFW
jgi:hypothetical protein